MPEETGQASGIWSTIEQLPIAALVRDEMWLYPALETVHVIGLGLLFGSIFAFDLRLLGWHRDLSVMSLHRHLLPWVWAGFSLNAASGVLLFSSEATKFAENPAFLVKMSLIILAGLNALLFQRQVFPRMSEWDIWERPPLSARVSAVLSIGVWLGIIIAGRMMAYVK